MLAEDTAKSKPPAWLTRYELVAVAIPGAVLLFGLWSTDLVRAAPVISKIDLTKIDIGSLGLFAVAAFCAGQIIQALGAFFEWMLLRYNPRDRTASQVSLLPSYLQKAYAARLAELGELDPAPLTRRDYRKDVYVFLMARLYRFGMTERLADLRVSWGLHRGLAVSFLALAIVFGLEAGGGVTALGLLIAAGIMVAMTFRYRRQFERQAAFEFTDLKS